jgi:hypothetical protein
MKLEGHNRQLEISYIQHSKPEDKNDTPQKKAKNQLLL